MRVLVTGGGGTLGTALREFLTDAHFVSREEWDVTDAALAEVWMRNRPDVVVHAAAITDHQCPDINLLLRTNYEATRVIVYAAQRNGVKVVYLSTHYVYPGRKGNYKETDPLCPIGNYAWTKMAGETWLRPQDLIIRGSWYDAKKLAQWKGAPKDAICNREPVRDAAQKIASLIEKGADGIYNIGGKRRTFWDIAQENGLSVPRIHRGMISAPYPFPADSSVNTEKYEQFVRS